MTRETEEEAVIRRKRNAMEALQIMARTFRLEGASDLEVTQAVFDWSDGDSGDCWFDRTVLIAWEDADRAVMRPNPSMADQRNYNRCSTNLRNAIRAMLAR